MQRLLTALQTAPNLEVARALLHETVPVQPHEPARPAAAAA
jgi:hypothetical protein